MVRKSLRVKVVNVCVCAERGPSGDFKREGPGQSVTRTRWLGASRVLACWRWCKVVQVMLRRKVPVTGGGTVTATVVTVTVVTVVTVVSTDA